MIGVFGLLVMVCSHTLRIEGKFIEESHIVLPTERVEKLTHLHYYFHDILDGEHPTSIKIIDSPNHSLGGFGVTFMVDNPLTEGPDLSSKEVGRAQGTYALASQHDLGFKMVMNFFFSEGAYEGSSLCMLGRNAVLDEIREMPIVGGSGVFRFARGYALANTVWSNSTSGNAIVEYHVWVYHLQQHGIQ
ncbi:dirigent protein 21-like [Vigna unguiculata]|uniref:Dirigent protein n=1 Tax=Vigna unguiculata TaxID=3917 RepID=A0A4D6M6F8_VIGUN|nr:dirigent protein 21-like [Vigna unguiculata]QCD95756.1 Plant disease resistance response protein [Vigna unguiculata]